MPDKHGWTRRELLAGGIAASAVRGRAQDPEEPIGTLPRVSCFYQIGRQTIDIYAGPNGLRNDPGYVHVFAHSHASAYADAGLAAYIHDAGSSFAYAPAFDLHEHAGWRTADEAQLAAWGRGFRDDVLAKGADFFAFNELPTNTGRDPQTQDAIRTLLFYLNEVDNEGRQLPGTLFMTHAPSMPANWDSPGSEFWQRVDETCALVVAEHYHGFGFICQNSETFLSNHFFAMRDWLASSGEPGKVSIAGTKFTVLHASRYGPGPSGWQGGNSDVITIEQFQADLAKCAKVTRNRQGGFNRISFAPAAAVYFADRAAHDQIHQHIRDLINWHYNQNGSSDELLCVRGNESFCQCCVSCL